jgi:hypothetical protein
MSIFGHHKTQRHHKGFHFSLPKPRFSGPIFHKSSWSPISLPTDIGTKTTKTTKPTPSATRIKHVAAPTPPDMSSFDRGTGTHTIKRFSHIPHAIQRHHRSHDLNKIKNLNTADKATTIAMADPDPVGPHLSHAMIAGGAAFAIAKAMGYGFVASGAAGTGVFYGSHAYMKRYGHSLP